MDDKKSQELLEALKRYQEQMDAASKPCPFCDIPRCPHCGRPLSTQPYHVDARKQYPAWPSPYYYGGPTC